MSVWVSRMVVRRAFAFSVPSSPASVFASVFFYILLYFPQLSPLPSHQLNKSSPHFTSDLVVGSLPLHHIHASLLVGEPGIEELEDVTLRSAERVIPVKNTHKKIFVTYSICWTGYLEQKIRR